MLLLLLLLLLLLRPGVSARCACCNLIRKSSVM